MAGRHQAPPFDNFRGYEGATFKGNAAPPPSRFGDRAPSAPPLKRPTVKGAVRLSEEEVRSALIDFVNQDCCFGKDPALKCKIHAIEPACAYHYTLETYTERRDTCWAIEPYEGRQLIDGPFNGPPPMPWQVQIHNNIPAYENGEISCPVPHTQSVKPCHGCNGVGSKECKKCSTKGKISCEGHMPECKQCDGSGFKNCPECQGKGTKQCDLCKGHKQLIYYVKLTVSMKNHKDEYLLDKTKNSSLPPDVVKKAEGETAYEEAGPRIWPMGVEFPEQQVVFASKRLVEQHNGAFPNELIHRQRQRVRVIPVSRVYCSYEQKDKQFYVYGLESKVHFPDYYSNCCGCCTVM